MIGEVINWEGNNYKGLQLKELIELLISHIVI